MKKWYVITGILVLLWIISLVTCSSNSAQVDKLKANLASTTTQLNDAKANLAKAEQVIKELNTKYPPRDFWSVEELVEWLAKDTTDKLASADKNYQMGDAAGRLSDNAMKDGYILSLYPLKIANGYQLQNCAIISGSAYLVNPMTDGVTQAGSGIYGDSF